MLIQMEDMQKLNFQKIGKEDASRRDFTINAIYADIEGKII